MDLEAMIDRMAQTARIIGELTRGVSSEDADFQPDAESWSMLDTLDHLYREERGDFRAHLARGWNLPDPSQPVDDPPYAPGSLTAVVQAFLDERQQSLDWLRGLDQPDWTVMIPMRGFELSTADMLASWVAHDVLHMRQLVEIYFALTVKHTQPHSVRYAGEW